MKERESFGDILHHSYIGSKYERTGQAMKKSLSRNIIYSKRHILEVRVLSI